VKRIQLRVLPDPRFLPDSPEFGANLLVWAEAIRQVIRRPFDQQRGADIEEIRKGIHVLDALDKASDGVLELEDADWEHLRDKTLAMQWAFVDRRILEFVDDIVQAGEQSPLNVERTNARQA
jgi:hypothetical protein